MKQRLYNILNIKASESSQVFDLLAVQFFIGLATAFLNTISFTLFIYDFQVVQLPWVYLSVAGVLIVMNFLYEKLEHSLSPFRLLQIIICAGFLILLGVWGGLSFINKHVFIFVLLVTNTVIYMITGYAFWGLVSLLFNVRESRRVFSIVGAGDIPAKLIGYIITPLLIPVIGLVNVVWLAMIAFAVSLYLFNKLTKKESWNEIRKKISHDNHHHESTHTHSKQNLVTFFFDNKLIFSISLLSILSYNVFILIDYTFISQVKLKFENIADLAVYIATFFAIGRVVAIVFKLIFTSRLIEKLGIIYCLFVTPVVLALFCCIFFFYDSNRDSIVFIFGMMALITEVLRSTIQEPVFFVLFQPLKEQLRLKGHLIAKGFTLPPSLVIVGTSLLLLLHWGFSLSILFTIKIILINLVVWGAVIFLIQRYYLGTLHKSIKRGTFSSDEEYVYDHKTIDILLHKVRSGKSAEVIYSLDLLKKAGYPKFTALLHEQLGVGTTDVKQYVLALLELEPTPDVAFIKQAYQQEKDPAMQTAFVSALCKTDPEFLSQMMESLDGHPYDVRKTVIHHLLRQHEFHYLLRAGNEIDLLASSALPEERKLSLEIMSDVKHVHFSKIISNLIDDEDQSVKRAAVAAACKMKMQSLLPQILQVAENPVDKPLVMKGLQQYGDKLFEDIHQLPESTVAQYANELVKIAPAIKGEHCRSFLLASVELRPALTAKTIHALWAQNYEPRKAPVIHQLEQLLQRYLQLASEKIDDYYKLDAFEADKAILKNSLLNEVKSNLVTTLEICAMLYKKKSVKRMLEMLQVEKNDKIYNAIEMIELELPKRISKDLNWIFDFVLDPQGHRIKVTPVADANIFEKIYRSDLFAYNVWTKAILMYCSWKNRQQDNLQLIARAEATPQHAIIDETRNFVLDNLN